MATPTKAEMRRRASERADQVPWRDRPRALICLSIPCSCEQRTRTPVFGCPLVRAPQKAHTCTLTLVFVALPHIAGGGQFKVWNVANSQLSRELREESGVAKHQALLEKSKELCGMVLDTLHADVLTVQVRNHVNWPPDRVPNQCFDRGFLIVAEEPPAPARRRPAIHSRNHAVRLPS